MIARLLSYVPTKLLERELLRRGIVVAPYSAYTDPSIDWTDWYDGRAAE